MLQINLKKLFLIVFCTVLWTETVQSNIAKEIVVTAIETGKATAATISDIASIVKKETWDAPIGKSKNGGKIILLAMAAVLTVDQLYAHTVNRELNQELSKAKEVIISKDGQCTQEEYDLYVKLKKRQQKTIIQKIKERWNDLDRDYQVAIVGTGISIFASLVLMKLMNNTLSPANFTSVDPKNIVTRFKDIVGAEVPKQEIQKYLEYAKNPAAYQAIGANPVTGIILHGPPGTGKTELARATAKEASLPFINTTGSDFNGIYRGSGTEQIKKLEKYAQSQAPCVVFIDEIDGAVRKQGNHHGLSCADSQATTNKFKTLLDGFQKQDPRKPILFIGATNNLSDIDPAIIRDGRLTPIEVGFPDKQSIQKMFDLKLYGGQVKAEPGIDTKSLTSQVYKLGYTGAQVAAAVNKAAFIAIGVGKAAIDGVSMQQAIAGS